ncbi:MAG: electron transfer flavoprotein [Deltaproteobacteria bacterium]|nr:MAG: electron transfer flavoprotein [Deltaproteobacteria bacterium]
MSPLVAPAHYKLLGFLPTVIFSVLIPIVGVALFTYIMAKRIQPLVKAAPDNSRFGQIPERLKNIVMIWLGQWRQPRYMMAGVLHIAIFFGFLVLSIRSTSLVFVGMAENFALPGFGHDQLIGMVYNVAKDYAATFVFIACLVAAIRRGVFRPERYAVPEGWHDHTAEAVFVTIVIMTLMVSESMFEAALVSAEIQKGMHAAFLAPGTLAWVFRNLLLDTPVEKLQTIHVASYYVHDFTFFFFLCFLPLGKHFHVITSLFNVFFMRVKTGNIKPVKYGITEEELEELDSLGTKQLEDFTWKHILDFYTCADCGRCADQCPANIVGRPLAPRLVTIKGRDKVFQNYPLMGDALKSEPLIGDIYSEEEIWSCTTCGACEQECPIGIEYIDKYVDLRRGMVDEGMVPQTLQKPLKALSKRGNPWGKVEKKRADWTKAIEEDCPVKVVANGDTAETLYFVDSISSYDDRMQSISQATAKILNTAGVDFAILGKDEKDSGNEVVRFGEEFLFQDLRRHNTEMIIESGAKKVVTADPHAYNALKNDYPDLTVPVEHISHVLTRSIAEGKIRLKSVMDPDKVYTYHDPCYLGRHNGVYDDPRNAMDAIEGLRRVEMIKSRDRSFCCSGGGLMLFYEPEEEERMGVLRVKMAAKAGANVIVTACPFCLVNIEDSIKVAGLEGKLEAVDFCELIEQHIVR